MKTGDIGNSTKEIDMTEETKRWKIERDPFYREVYRAFGEEKVLEAGFIYDSDEVNRDVTSTTGLLCTPLGKIAKNLEQYRKNPAAAKGPCVLVNTGSFAPIHEGHTLIMGQAKAAAEAAGWEVVGGFISPSHDEYIRAKTWPDWIRIHHRLRAVQRMVKGSDWLAADPWEGVFNKVAINFTDVIVRTEAYLRHHVGDVPVFFVCGGDNARFALTFLAKGRCIVVNRPGYEDRFNKYKRLLSGLVPAPGAEERILWSEGGNALSSTGIRKAHSFTSESPAKLTLRVEEMSPLEPAIRGLLGRRFERVTEKTASEQREQFKDISSLPLISLDPIFPGKRNFEVSRLYDLFGACQLGYTNRPGSAPVGTQGGFIEDGSYYLFDDDIHTGGTMKYAKSMLPDAVKVKGVFSFSVSAADEGEILDCRDFIVDGNPLAGLVVRLPDGAQARAPYVYPYVCPFFRASVDDPLGFSIEVWSANAEHYRDRPDTLADYPNWLPLFGAAGFSPEDKMFHVCEFHRNLLTTFVNENIK
jgi:nicotinic acid mononucleotide adenylyltransferase